MDITIADHGETTRWIGQAGVPFRTPLGFPLVNPLVHKQMQFRKEYKVTGVTLDEARTGILCGNYRPFMDIREETFSRNARTRRLVFNPFTVEMEKYCGVAGDLGTSSGRMMGSAMGAMLGLITWEISEDPPRPGVAAFEFKTINRLFSGHFKIRVRADGDGVIFDDDWTTEGGSDMRTEFLPMANLVLLTHPKGFEHIVREFVDEVRRARAARQPYTGEIGPPSRALD
jgi:hypothetical protein